jgi:hypothetical protein
MLLHLSRATATWPGVQHLFRLPDSSLVSPWLIYLLVAEFFPHDYSDKTNSSKTGFSEREETPVLIQNIIISR